MQPRDWGSKSAASKPEKTGLMVLCKIVHDVKSQRCVMHANVDMSMIVFSPGGAGGYCFTLFGRTWGTGEVKKE